MSRSNRGTGRQGTVAQFMNLNSNPFVGVVGAPTATTTADTPVSVKPVEIPSAILAIVDKNSKMRLVESDYEMALLWYVGRGDEVSVKSLLDEKTETNIIDVSGNTPLNVAVSKDFYSIFCMLIDQGADIGVKDVENDTLLHIAVYNNAENIAVKLMEIQNDIHALDDDCNSAFSIAIGNKMTTVVSKLLEKRGIEDVIDVSNNYGNTPFLLACATKQLDIAMALLSKGVNIVVANTIGDTPLSEASFSGLYEIVSRLITDEKIDINQVNKNNETPLLRALNGGNTDIAKLLLSLPICKVETQSLLSVTPLIVAVTKGFMDIVDLLLTKDDVTFENSLLLACEFGYADVFDLIIKHDKASITCFNNRKNTPFLLAMSRCDEVMATKLLEKGSDPTVRNEDNETAIILAIKAANSCLDGEKCIKLISAQILHRRIDINCTTVSGVSAAVCSINLDKMEMLELLLREYSSCIDMSLSMGANGYCLLHYAAIPKEGNANDKNGLLKLLFTDTNVDSLVKAMERECNDGYTPIIYALCYGYKVFVDSAKELFGSEKIMNFIIEGLAKHTNRDEINECVTKYFGNYSNIGNIDPLRDFVRKLAMNKIVESNKDSNIQHAELASLVALKSMASYVKETDINIRHHKESMIKCLTEAENSVSWLNLALCCIDNFLTSIVEQKNYTVEASLMSLLYDFIEKLSNNNDLLAPMMASSKYLSQFMHLLYYIGQTHGTIPDGHDDTDGDLHASVKRFYQAVNGDPSVDTLLARYEGKEGLLIKKLCDKYKCNMKDHFGPYLHTFLLHNDSDHSMLLDPKLGFYCMREFTNVITKASDTCTPSAKCSSCNVYVAKNSKGSQLIFDHASCKIYCSTAYCTPITPCNYCSEFLKNEVKKSESLGEILPYKRSPLTALQVAIIVRMNRLAFVNVGGIHQMLHAVFKVLHGESLSKCAQLLQSLYLYKETISASEINDITAMFKAKLANWDRVDAMCTINAVTEFSKRSKQFSDVAKKDFVGYVLKVISHFKFNDPDMSLVMVKYLLTQTFDEAYIEQTCLLLANAVDSFPAVADSVLGKATPGEIETLECSAELMWNLTNFLPREKALAIYAELSKKGSFVSRLEHYTQNQATSVAQPRPVFNFSAAPSLQMPLPDDTLSAMLQTVALQPPLTFNTLPLGPPQTSPFGATTPQASPFGATTPQASPFGASTPQASGITFGASTPQASPFGASTPQVLSFGASTQQASPFGASTPQALPFGASQFGAEFPSSKESLGASQPPSTSVNLQLNIKFMKKLLDCLKQAHSPAGASESPSISNWPHFQNTSWPQNTSLS